MLSHYVKVSFRELLKYRTQSIVSIIGLAVGFTTFILGGYWLWWETHFDNSIRKQTDLLPDDRGTCQACQRNTIRFRPVTY